MRERKPGEWVEIRSAACGILLGLGMFATTTAHAQFGYAGGVAFQPGLGSVLDGAALNVTPVVSADRRYVRMSLTPYFNGVQGFQTVVVPGAVSSGGGFGGGLNGGFGGGGNRGFGSVGPGALGPGAIPAQSGAPFLPLAPPLTDPLANAFVVASQPEPLLDQTTPEPERGRPSVSRSRQGSAGNRSKSQPRMVRQP